ncbi:LCP family protein [Trueperella bialowiezensis]|nr:LCP family protein [Trueperella bialowiezensis]
MDVATPPERRSPAHRKRPPVWGAVLRILILALIGALVTGASAAAMMYHNISTNLVRHDISDFVPAGERPTTPPPVDGARGRPINILVMGSDARTGASDIDGSGAAGEVTGMRSDTTMLVHISADRRRADVVSIPRDTLVDIPSCVLPDGTRTRAQYEAMFNSAFEIGGRTGDVGAAASCTVRTVEELTNIYIDGFVVVDFASFQDVVNTLGGVDVCLSEPVSDSYAGLELDAGCQTLNGEQALGLARARKSLGDGSDISRINRQQQIVGAIVTKALSLNLVGDLPALYGMVESLSAHVETSTSLGSISELAGLAYSLRNISLDDITMVTMPFEPAGHRVVPAYAAGEVWEAIIHDQPLPDIQTQNSAQSPILEGTKTEIEQFQSAVGGGVRLEDS